MSLTKMCLQFKNIANVLENVYLDAVAMCLIIAIIN